MTPSRPIQRRRVLAFGLLGLAAIAPAIAAGKSTPARDIEALIERVAASRGVVFIRNGTEHTAPDAASHLRRKWRAADGRIKTPEQFIDTLGTRSSVTGVAYRVRLPDGREIDSAAWLTGLLRDIRAGR